MSNTLRDTQFAGFAKLLWEELLELRGRGYIDVANDMMDEEWNAEYRQIIARRAYDLVGHALENIDPNDLDRLSPDERVLKMPDLTEWPEEVQ